MPPKKSKRYRLPKRRFMKLFFLTVFILFIVRKCAPTADKAVEPQLPETTTMTATVEAGITEADGDSILLNARRVDSLLSRPVAIDYVAAAQGRGHRLRYLTQFGRMFNDSNHVQLSASERLGIQPLQTRHEVLDERSGLVFVGASPYYYTDNLTRSVPYLVPRAARLLDRIGRNFVDSQYVKHFTPRRFVVTSVLRTEEDVRRLRRYNGNASPNSAHRYATTFDIGYYNFRPDTALPRVNGWPRANDGQLKEILAEVLDDLQRAGACYVKYEVKQPCFHITAR